MPVLSVVQVTTNDSSLMCLKMILAALGINIIFNISSSIRIFYTWIKNKRNKVQQDFVTVTTVENITAKKNSIKWNDY